MEEIWKEYDIMKRPNQYNVKWSEIKIEVSNFGNVRTTPKVENAVIINCCDRRCILGTAYPVFHAVWKLFAGQIPDGFVIHHIDGDKHNDNLNNLALMTKGAHAKIHFRGKNKSEQAINKRTRKRVGRRAYNNGIIVKYAYECPEGFVLGGLPLSEEHKLAISNARKSIHK